MRFRALCVSTIPAAVSSAARTLSGRWRRGLIGWAAAVGDPTVPPESGLPQPLW